MKKNAHIISMIILVVIAYINFCGMAYGSNVLQLGAKYRIVQPIFLMAVYDSLNNRINSKETARAYLHSQEYYKKSWVAFQSKVPPGTIMTIVKVVPKAWYLLFSDPTYIVQLEPDISRGLDIVLELERGLEGDLDGLNGKLFERLGDGVK